VAALDKAAFDAFNSCATPGQLQQHAGFFSEKYVCGNFRRELVPGTLRVFPIKDFGAISQGEHRFCQFKTGKCEGTAEFVMIWRQQGSKWTITRVLSYGHRHT
jgi:hypothetical protein